MNRISFLDDLPCDPLIVREDTPYGWRGLTAKGEILEVHSRNGIPSGEVVMARGGSVVARLAQPADNVAERASIDEYLKRYEEACVLCRANRPLEALTEWNAALALAPTAFGRFNRALTLLALGRWTEGFEEYRECELIPGLMRPLVREAVDAGIKQWRGEPIAGKRLLLIHSHGFGDTLMTLRYVDQLMHRGADVTLLMPPPLESLAAQIAPVVSHVVPADYFCSMLHLPGILRVSPDNLGGLPAPYLRPSVGRVGPLNGNDRPRIGIAWSTGMPDGAIGGYHREIPLARLVASLGDAEIHSVQIQGGEEARALGVVTYDFEDFGHCAELMMSLDRIISVDTAALHLAGAIGHPHVTGLLRDWHSWRWLAPWYGNVTLRRFGDGN
jgi:hypothetical protein